jgi:hypothetical protein
MWRGGGGEAGIFSGQKRRKNFPEQYFTKKMVNIFFYIFFSPITFENY